ncbi:acetyl-CoA C-acetyltransferase [Fimbriimonas ginsengisoli]|uniref:Acetyl-CoA acetyltransferase n=1 Tax=Fimbriimonas ginsengisoli Gsoil 348 TaxID=661478 RepID=A0A068NYD2_FIMGI|nr:acetyl-CoA C-acetyltransferase [Fimbriimonas ginsengisoli]AIE86869.1 acetyl-CoA acetyltransferase [Fimbriimonas ginsengisoli Gsoil 348]
MEDVVILAGARTPIGAFMGALSTFTGPQLGSFAIKAALERAGVSPEEVDEVIMGEVLTGAVGQAPARQAAIAAGLPTSVPALTVNKVCGSGMKAAMLAAQAVKLGDSKIVVAGGMESMTNAPYALDKARTGYRMGNGKLIDTMIHDGLWDPYGDCHMGTCGDATAASLDFSREQLDEFAAESYRRALDAQAAGRFTDEIVPVSIPQRKGDPVIVDKDEEPAKGDISKLPSLRPAFGKEGVTTAGNASSLDDGGCALIVASMTEAERRGAKPLGRIVGYSTHAQDPQWFTTAPAFAVQKLLEQHNLKVSDIDLFEVNEAFAVVAMAVGQKVEIPRDRLNVNGGAVALGHPIGMTGARLILTALLELRRRGGRYAIATPCIGGGEATAVLLEAM